MTASPEMLGAFEAWRLAELASHYASPCPDDVMSALVDQSGDRLADLNAQPATNADDFLLQVFPLLLWVFEPQRGSAPMRPELPDNSGTAIAEGYQVMISNIGRISPTIAAAMTAPRRLA